MATDGATVNCLEYYYGLLNCQYEGVVSHADGSSVSSLDFPAWEGGTQRAHRWVSHESVEPRIALDTGGAQDLYPALGWRCLLQNSHVTNSCKTHCRTTTVSSHPQQQCFTLRPPASLILCCRDAHNLRLFAPDNWYQNKSTILEH